MCIRDRANLALDPDRRQPFYAAHQVAVTQGLPILPLFARPQSVIATSVLCGLEPGPVDPITWNVSSWTFDETGACADSDE
ncbi:MAG: hypothetical protein GYB68_06230, partial [Chloroflexi bacterium]|nr:hypothetical protein [Chloroflexota bacterium]